MRSIYYRKLKRIYTLSHEEGKRCYCNGTLFIMPLYEYYTYIRIGVNKYA